MKETIQDHLFALMLKSRKDAAVQLIAQYADQYGSEAAVIHLLEPALNRFGVIWAGQENVSLAQGYIVARIAEEVLAGAAAAKPVYIGQKKGPIVIGNIEDDYHDLGRKLVTTFLRAYGWQVVDMGNDVLAEDLFDQAQSVKSKVIAVSAMMYTTAMNIQKVRQVINRHGLKGKIKLAVGGAVFLLRPELVDEVGGDGTSRNALGAPELMKSLWEAADRL
ncbi:cobalamin-dependent protein [bacterium]|nr:cobalamin-dependent protein [bacterium]